MKPQRLGAAGRITLASLSLAVLTCGSPTPQPPHVVVHDAADAQAPSAEEVARNRVLRGELVRSYVSYSSLRSLARDGDVCAQIDGGTCPWDAAVAFVQAYAAQVATRVAEVEALAKTHVGALPDEPQCLESLVDASDHLADALRESHDVEAARRALAQRVGSCDELLKKNIIALGGHVPNHAEPGHIQPETIQRVVRENFGRFKACYERGLERDPSLGGRLRASFIIDLDGSVLDARADEALADAKATDCILHQLAAIRFPAPDGYVSVVYPLVFTPKQGNIDVDTTAGSGLAPDQIRTVVVAHASALRACYDGELTHTPALKGTVTVTWMISSGGSVYAPALLESTMGNARVEACIVKAVSSWQFPTASAPTHVSAYPFKFGPP